jgi:WD40 repeat protein
VKLVGLANVPIDDEPGAATLAARSSALADLAFGSFSHGSLSGTPASGVTLGRHLAFLPADTLELDLSDPTQRHFGDYELLELIGEGGMGVVYRARQTSLDREVAIKLLAAGPWASREFVDRFLREARHAAGMQHPNIVTVYEVGTAEELHFFSMRLVRGASLSLTLRRDGPLDSRRAAALMRIVAEAVDYAHSLGVLHLDLKPANVLLDENGTPHVADFGLARRLDLALSVPNNEISGTPSYMAPEQAEVGKQSLTPATDIWGLGAILYELVTGHPPFRADSAQATLELVQKGTLLRPRRSQPKLPLDLDAIIVKCLAKEPVQRYATARALAEDLARFCEHRAVLARPLHAPQRIARWARREPRLAATAVLAFGALLIGLVATTQQWRRAEGNAATATERLWESRRDAALRLQMDGKGFEALPGLLANIHEQEHAGQSAPASIERREIGAVLGQGVTLLHRMILPDASPLAVELSPDGSLMAVGLSDFSVRWFDTRTLRELGRVDLEGLPTSDGEPRLPTLLTFTENRRLRVTLEWFEFVANPSGGDSFLVDLDRAEVITPPQFADLRETIYSADGQFALLRNRHQKLQLWQVEPWRPISPLLAETARPRGTPWALGRSARFAIPFDPRMPWPEIYDPRNLKIIRTIAHPAEVIISAWAENSDGSAMAFGDASGRMFLVDLRSFTMRQLPTPLGREVTSIAFSEDDAWLAAVRWDGAAYAFNVATGEPLNAGQMQHDFTLRQVSILHRQHLLIASGPGPDGPGRTEIWRLPEPGPYGAEAKRLIASPTRSAPVGMYTAGVSAQSGLLATASIDGEVRLWRLPLSPTLPMRTSLLVSGALYFDGEHVVDIEYAKLRVASTLGAAPTRWIELPQPVDFADLVDGARTLIATAGAEIYVFDAVTMTPRYPAIKLAANPQRLVISEDGASIVLAYGHTGARGFEERLETYDLRTGQRRLADATVSGPLRQLELSADGSKVLTTGPAHGATDVFETTTLRHIGTYPHDARTPVVWAAFDSGSGKVLLITRSEDDPRADDGNLVFWDPASSTERERRPIQHASQIGVISALGNPFIAGRDQDLLDSGVLGERIAPRLSRGEATAVLSVSHDGHLIAHAFRREVQLYDATTAAAVGAPLHTDINPADLVVQLAFSKDDRRLLARTTLGHWLLWQIAADIRPLAEIRQDADLLVPTAGAQRIVRIPDTGENERLRRRDTGTWPATDTRPLQPASREVAGGRIPARSSGTSPLLLDLTYAYTLAPDSLLNFAQSVFATMRPFPLGIVRLNGIDYDARGAIDLSRVQEISMRREGIRVPQIPIAAFHVLMFAQVVSPTPHEELFATVRLRYQDGTEARLPIRTQREVPGWSDADLPVPLAWVFGDQLRLMGYQRQQMISDPRLPNPHPERLITTLDLEAVQGGVFFAITAEPVIAEDDSGIPPNKGDVKLKPES